MAYSLLAKTLFQWFYCFMLGKEYQVFPKCVPSWEKLLLDKSALSHKSQKPAKKHHWWTLFCRFVTASPEPQLQHKVCAGRYVMQACTFCHGRHARAAGGMNVDIRGDAQIGSNDCFFWRQAASQSACVSWIKTLRSWRESSCWRILFGNKSFWTIIANPLYSVIEYAHLVLRAFSNMGESFLKQCHAMNSCWCTILPSFRTCFSPESVCHILEETNTSFSSFLRSWL